jgi:hypothetical protein
MAWELKGNAGTDPSNFLGTTDDQPVIIKTNNQEAVRINAEGGTSGKVEVTVGQEGLTVTGLQPFITLRDRSAGDVRSLVQCIDGDVAFIPSNSGGTIPAMVLKANTGKVGIGTTNPSSQVEIVAQDGLSIIGFQPFITLLDTNANNAACKIHCVDGGMGLDVQNAPSVFIQANTGNVGIGTTKPSSKLEILAQDALSIIGFQPLITLHDTNANNAACKIHCIDGGMGLDVQNASSVFIQANTGNVGIGTTAPQAKLHVLGDIKASGGIQLHNADCAEDFDIADAQVFEPGTVMVLGRGGALQESRRAYDKRVAGVVSGAGEFRPGLVLDKRSDGARQPIALLGKVYCKVDAGYGAIDVGDLLTTSPTPGHAMKASDPIASFGAIIGKAMECYHDTRGLIAILVALQ